MKHTHAPQVYYSLTPKRTKQPQPSATREFYSRCADLISLLNPLLLPAPGIPLEVMLREAVRGEISKRRGIYADLQNRLLRLYEAAEHLRKAQQALEEYQRLP